ncbi:hypothetical protein FQ377_14250 [Arthrobacter echini]|uniref:TrbL/VirB6 plasmid conjugal transfer protein n=1 Tax=Arthrobacter echini TaxID=1529066 RepID=A0A5D0XHT8_9MICC|nr:hypothetical protein [Arthrobacter echini]TYC96192.1 hypothetical protein FQ377_14250 [Arthrobacter echini]
MPNIGDLLEGVAGSAIQKLIQFLASWVVQVLTEMINFVGTWWLKIGAPDMGSGSATDRIQQSTLVFVGMAGVIGTAFALIKLARDQDRASTENLIMGMVRTVLTTALAVPMVGLLFGVTDVVAPWLVRTISGSAQEDGLGSAMGLEALAGTTMTMQLAGIILFVAPLALLGAIINAVIVIFSYGAAIALCGVLPIFAAASQTERGRKSFDKAVGWLAAVVLFKPAAAILYGAGLALLKGINGTADNELGNTAIGLITGLVIICSACVAMPALAKVLVPAVSAGPQGMGASGLAMVGGAVALGAITGGVGAAAGAAATGSGGSAAAFTGGGAAATTAASASEAAGAAGTAGGAATGTSGGTSALSGSAGTGSEATGATSSGGGTAGSTGGGAGSSGSTGTEQRPEQPPTPGAAAGSISSAGHGGSTGAASGGPTGAEQRPDRSGAESSPVSDAGTGAGTFGSGASGTGGNSGSGSDGPMGAQPQAERVGAPTEAPADPAGGTSGNASTAGGPSGAEPTAGSAELPKAPPLSDGEIQGGTSASPTAEGFRSGAPSGADKSAMTKQRVEFGLREAARDMDRAVESGDDS